MPGRTYSAANTYRYGFNGKENDNEVKGEGNQQDYGMRIYDSRIGKFLSVDPLTKSYPYYTPYSFAGNKPVLAIDLDGLEEASPSEMARAKKYLTQTISSYIIKNQTYTKFKQITGECLVEELNRMFSNPGEVLKKQDDGVGNVCGLYAFSYLFAMYNPIEFIQGVASMYITSEMTTNGMETNAIDGIAKTKKDYTNQSALTFIFGGSIRDRGNNFNDFDGNAARYWGSTNTGTMKDWITNFLGSKVSELKIYGPSKRRDNTFQTMANNVNKGNDLVVRVSQSVYQTLADGGKLQIGAGAEAKLSFPGGDHWIVVSGQMKFDKKSQKITMIAFDMNNGLKTFTLTVEQFQSMSYDVLQVGDKIKN